jgi:hypothetical protein
LHYRLFADIALAKELDLDPIAFCQSLCIHPDPVAKRLGKLQGAEGLAESPSTRPRRLS